MNIAPRRKPLTLKELREKIGGELVGRPDILIDHVAPVTEAGEGALTLVAEKKAGAIAEKNLAAAYIIEKKYAEGLSHLVNGIIVKDGRVAFAACLELFSRRVLHSEAISSKAVIEYGAKIGKNATVYDYAFIAAGAEIGANTVIYPFVFIGPGSKIGSDSTVYPHVVIRENVTVGDRAILHSGVILGVDGFGFVPDKEGWKKVPQIGGVVIGDDVELFSNTSVASGAAGPTVIGDGVKLGDMTHVGHNSHLEANTIMAGQTGIGGSTSIGQRVMVGGQVMFAGHQTVGDKAGIMSKSLVEGDIGPGQIVSGNPARDNRSELRIKASLRDLPDLKREVRRLTKALKELEEKTGLKEI